MIAWLPKYCLEMRTSVWIRYFVERIYMHVYTRICARRPLAAYNYLFQLHDIGLLSPLRISPPFLLQRPDKRSGFLLIYFFFAGLDAWSRESPWRSRPRVFIGGGPGTWPRPRKPGICQWHSFRQNLLRKSYFDAFMFWCQRDALVPSVQQRSNDRIPTESLSMKTQEARFVTYVAPNCFIMTRCNF